MVFELIVLYGEIIMIDDMLYTCCTCA